MRFTPLKKKGRHGQEMEVIRRKVWPRVLNRAPARQCEGCEAKDRTLQWSHIFGRSGTGGGLGAWADTVELTSKLCVSLGGDPGCHDRLDRHLDDLLALRLTWAAIRRLAVTCGINLELLQVTPANFSAVDAIRYLVRVIEGEGWSVDAETMTPVRAA